MGFDDVGFDVQPDGPIGEVGTPVTMPTVNWWHRFCCRIGFHHWEVRMLMYTGKAWCRNCGATGIFTGEYVLRD